jgi:spore germination cell wall hydrolase CwlJ-like protein
MVFMTKLLRSPLLFAAALSVSCVAPAQAGPSDDPVAAVQPASLPKVDVPRLLDTQSEPELAAPPSAPIVVAPEAAPGVDRGGDLSAKVAQLRGSEPGSRELECLAVGVYFESKSEPLAGQLAVGKVIANRANSGGRFPSSYCGVLMQRGQFSFIRGRGLPSVPRASRQWHNAVAIAKIVSQDLHSSPVGKALFFHARRVSPNWRLKRITSIGNHIFYR